MTNLRQGENQDLCCLWYDPDQKLCVAICFKRSICIYIKHVCKKQIKSQLSDVLNRMKRSMFKSPFTNLSKKHFQTNDNLVWKTWWKRMYVNDDNITASRIALAILSIKLLLPFQLLNIFFLWVNCSVLSSVMHKINKANKYC